MIASNPKVDAYLVQAKKWHDEIKKLRKFMFDCKLTEELKWGKPCYTLENSNIVIIIGFKAYCALLFFKGALMKDPKQILITPTKNMQAGRQIRFTSKREVVQLEPTIKAYIREAIAVERSGLKIPFKSTADFALPTELENALDKNHALRKAFYALTPGRQRAYILYFSAAKQSKTRESRVVKCTVRILDGKGLNDP